MSQSDSAPQQASSSANKPKESTVASNAEQETVERKPTAEAGSGKASANEAEAGSKGSKRNILKYLLGGVVTTCILVFAFVKLGRMLIQPIVSTVKPALISLLSPLFDEAGASYLLIYFNFAYLWIIVVLVMVLVKPWRPFLKAIGTKPSGNTPKMLVIGLGIGLLLNSSCIFIAFLAGNIKGFELSAFEPIQIAMFLVAILIQSSLEELIMRCFAYQRILRVYRPAVAIIATSVIFAALHLTNEGITLTAFLSIVASGVVLALAVYYLNSFWMAAGIHTGWNFCQGALFGLPNSGNATGYAIFRPVGEVTGSIAYDPVFGVEGTIFAIIVLAIAAAAIIYWGKKHPRPKFNVDAD